MKYNPSPAYILAGRCEIRLKLAPGYQANSHKFTFGSCDGLLMLTPTAYEVVAVINERPGNGTFAKFLTHLKALAQQHRRDIFVMEIHAPYLGPHLAKHHGYQLLPGTRHAFLPVAGPGTVPLAYSQPAKPGRLDNLLDLLTSALF